MSTVHFIIRFMSFSYSGGVDGDAEPVVWWVELDLIQLLLKTEPMATFFGTFHQPETQRVPSWIFASSLRTSWIRPDHTPFTFGSDLVLG